LTGLLALVCWWLFAEWPMFAFRRNQHFTIVKLSEKSFHTSYPLVLGGILLAVFLAFALKGWGFRGSRVLFGRIGLAAFFIYLLICATAHWIALKHLERFAKERGTRVASRADAFSFVGPIRWNGAVLAPEGVYDGEITPFSSSPMLKFYPTAAESPFLVKSRSVPEVRQFLSEARLPVSCYQIEGSHHIVEFYDHGPAGAGVARVVLNEQQEVLTMHWIAVDDYISPASHGNVSAGVVSTHSTTPCFLR
jgi:hypothetical protein